MAPNLSGFVRGTLIALVSAGVGAVVGWHAHERGMRNDAVAQAKEAYEQGRFDLALRLAQRELRDPAHPRLDAALVAARSLAALKRWPEVVKAFELAIPTEPKDYARLAMAHYQTRSVSEALKTVADGLKAHPNDPQLAELETRLLVFEKDVKGAHESADRLAAIPGKEALGRLFAGLIDYAAGNYAQAADELQATVTLSPALNGQSDDFPKTTRDFVDEALATSLLFAGNPAAAYDFARAAYEARPTAVRALIAAKAAAAQKSWNDAGAWIERVLGLDPNNTEAYSLRIELALERGDLSAAESAVDKLASLGSLTDQAFQHTVKAARARIAAARRAVDANSKRKRP